MVKHYCDDPLKKHKTKVSKNFRIISDKLHDKLNRKLSRTTRLCNNCRITLEKNPEFLETPLSESEESVASASSTKTTGSVGFQDGRDSDINEILTTLDVSPIKKRKLRKCTM